MTPSNPPNKLSSAKLQIRYENPTALQTSQFIAHGTEDGIILDCCSAPLITPDSTQPTLPVHTRLAVSRASLGRLMGLLSQVDQEQKANDRKSSHDPVPPSHARANPAPARLPRLKRAAQ